jgi:hypothetical protein
MAVTIPAKRRVLIQGDKGLDVLAAQRCLKKGLKKIGLVPVNAANGTFGDGTLKDVMRFQVQHALIADGAIGAQTWTALDPYLDLYGKALLTPKPPPPATPGQRVVHQALVLASYAPRHYTQVRPYAGTLPTWRLQGGDCSGTSILSYKLAGLPDPNSTNYDGSGNTYSLIRHGVSTSPIAGALTFYGSGAPEHVVIEIGNGTVVSHGHEGGPRILPRNYRGDYLETRRYV